MPSTSPSQGMRNHFGVRNQFTQISPDQLIQLGGGNMPGGTFLLATRLDGVGFAPTSIVVVARVDTPSGTGQLTDTATDQAPEEICVNFVVPSGELLILGKFGLNLIELFLPDEGRNRCDEDPLLLRNRRVAARWLSNGMSGRAPYPGRAGAGTPGIDVAGVDRVGENPAKGRRIPTGLTVGGGHLVR
jgi:hypothetical protein